MSKRAKTPKKSAAEATADLAFAAGQVVAYRDGEAARTVAIEKLARALADYEAATRPSPPRLRAGA